MEFQSNSKNYDSDKDYTDTELFHIQITAYTFYSLLLILNILYLTTRIVKLN